MTRLAGWDRVVRSAAFRGICVVSLIAPANVSALEYTGSVRYEGTYRSNPARSVGGEDDSDIVHEPGASFGVDHAGPRTSVGANYAARRRIYQNDAFERETVFEGGAYADWRVIPERLSVRAENQRQETEILAREQSVPTNLQETDQTSLSANLTLDSFSNHYINLEYAHEFINYDETGNDNERDTASIGYAIPLSDIQVLTLIGSLATVEFDDQSIPEYESRTGQVQYSRDDSVTAVTLRGGYQEIDRELARSTVDGFTGGISLSRLLRGASSITFSYDRDFRDSSLWARGTILDDPDLVRGLGDPAFVGDTDIGEVYTQQRAQLSYATEIGVNTVQLSLGANRQEYEDDNIDRDVDTAQAALTISRALRPNTTGWFRVSHRYYDFASEAKTDHETKAQIQVNWQRSPRLDIGLRASYFVRDQAEDLTKDDAQDWGVGIIIQYVLFASKI